MPEGCRICTPRCRKNDLVLLPEEHHYDVHSELTFRSTRR
jgi:hypothetical protein